MMIRLVLVSLALLLAFSVSAAAQQPHWLVGTWDGERKNVNTRNRSGTDRVLIVASVAADGMSAKGQWITANAKINVTLQIAGDTVSFTTPGTQGNSYKLTRKGDTLEGAWTAQGRGNSGAIALYKQ